MSDFRAEGGKVIVRGNYGPDGQFKIGPGPETALGLREAIFVWQESEGRQQQPKGPLRAAIFRAFRQRLTRRG